MDGFKLLTIGYGSRSIDEFIEILKAHEIAYLVDVRSKPYSRYKPEFSGVELERYLKANNIRYVFMGDSLGGRPEDRQYYTDDRVDYDKLKEADTYKAGIERLKKANSQALRIILMCSEGRPEQCHRSHLIGRTLHSNDIEVGHIDENGEVLSQDEVMGRARGPQMALPGIDEGLRTRSRKAYKEGHDDELYDDQ